MDLIDRRAATQTALDFIVEYLGGAFDEDFQRELIERMNGLPSAQPEIIRCKECKFYDHFWNGDWCSLKNIDVKDVNDFCSRAKGKTDE